MKSHFQILFIDNTLNETDQTHDFPDDVARRKDHSNHNFPDMSIETFSKQRWCKSLEELGLRWKSFFLVLTKDFHFFLMGINEAHTTQSHPWRISTCTHHFLSMCNQVLQKTHTLLLPIKALLITPFYICNIKNSPVLFTPHGIIDRIHGFVTVYSLSIWILCLFSRPIKKAFTTYKDYRWILSFI